MKILLLTTALLGASSFNARMPASKLQQVHRGSGSNN
eukprot:CAMPEP_0185765148 /NCGR_PEP_ID=MMETSP1174-20130828/26428_1 /TAXON_ID=35687 /ORGANISM="Dictyocha speculum, Strain CCMP1381" /LENGTH=36 /DNA_ID= /DNA_START= /DNA_END= /DNA_ORIENTATION=